MKMKKYAVVGTGGRAVSMFITPLLQDFKNCAEVAGLYDSNHDRALAAKRIVGQEIPSSLEIPVYEDFSRMMDQVNPDRVIVCTMDSSHAEYVVKSLKRGAAVFCEKPLCTTAEQARSIREAADSSSAEVKVTHNMRFDPNIEKMKEVILSGRIGKILHIQFIDLLDRFHGADYFRRWHRKMENSGGLMIHKASHHFDLINWFTNSLPERVIASGRLAFYGKNGPFRGSRCSGCSHAKKCPFYVDVFEDHRKKLLYRDVEKTDGYYRDGCVYDSDINIYDTVNAAITYRNGIEAGYSLIAYASYEATDIFVEGTLGRLEYTSAIDTSWSVGHKAQNKSLDNSGGGSSLSLMLYRPDEESENLTRPSGEGGHGGSDQKLRAYLFGDSQKEDPLGQMAELEDGIQAVLVGLAVNRSISQEGKPVAVQDLT